MVVDPDSAVMWIQMLSKNPVQEVKEQVNGN